MGDSVFLELQFWLLVLCSVVAPVGIYVLLMRLNRLSRTTVLCFGLFLVLLAGVDLLLQRIAVLARVSGSLIDDHLFGPELSMALYLLPLMSAGIGINRVSQVLLEHLRFAEKSDDERNRPPGTEADKARPGLPGTRS